MLKSWQGIMLAIFLTACTSAGSLSNQSAGMETGGDSGSSNTALQVQNPVETPWLVRADLEDLGPAPELANDVWLNTDQPLRLADLRGSVVLLDMWTFG